MCSRKRRLARGVPFFLFLPIVALSEDSLWQKINSEGRELREQGRYDEAEKASLLALAEAQKAGPEDYRVAISLNDLATLYHLRGRLRDAEPLYRSALDIWERLPKRPELATVLSNLGRLCLDQKKRRNGNSIQPGLGNLKGSCTQPTRSSQQPDQLGRLDSASLFRGRTSLRPSLGYSRELVS